MKFQGGILQSSEVLISGGRIKGGIMRGELYHVGLGDVSVERKGGELLNREMLLWLRS